MALEAIEERGAKGCCCCGEQRRRAGRGRGSAPWLLATGRGIALPIPRLQVVYSR